MNKKKIDPVGGQAVIEGVMMRSGSHIATAIRKKDRIVINKIPFMPLGKKYKILGLPLIRGVVSLFEMMYVGMKMLMWSAQEGLDEEEGEELKGWQIGITVIISLVFSLALFKFLPYLFTNVIGFRETNQPIIFNLIDGVIKIGILLIYLFAISRMKDIARIFQYHGAEHKAVNAYEKEKKATPELAEKYSRIHARCGTNFILNVFLIGVLVFSLVPVLVSRFVSGFSEMHLFSQFGILFLGRLMMLPIVAGVSYEWLRFFGRFSDSWFTKVMNMPGLLVQRITTNEPTMDQLEVSCAALNAALDSKK
jgi:uncharacterized protein YqhQ